jgi:putative ABC transport system ATP-binding protein
MRSSQALLSLTDVTCTRRVGGRTAIVLDAVSLAVWRGEHVGILGGRLQGKTALLRIAAGVELPASGQVRLDDADLQSLSHGERTRRLRSVALVAKEWRVARGKPALDHVGLPLLAEGRPVVTALAKAHEALERVGAAHCAGSHTDELSPGDMTRVALAQALVRKPEILLVDELGALADPDDREELVRLLRSIAGEQPELTLVVASRDVAGVTGATRVLTLGDGVLRGASRPAEADVLVFPSRPQQRAPSPDPARLP